jgi:hypothetical protein
MPFAPLQHFANLMQARLPSQCIRVKCEGGAKAIARRIGLTHRPSGDTTFIVLIERCCCFVEASALAR